MVVEWEAGARVVQTAWDFDRPDLATCWLNGRDAGIGWRTIIWAEVCRSNRFGVRQTQASGCFDGVLLLVVLRRGRVGMGGESGIVLDDAWQLCRSVRQHWRGPDLATCIQGDDQF